MEYRNCFRDASNVDVLQARPGILKNNLTRINDNIDLKNRTNNKENKFIDTKINCDMKNNLLDISMLSMSEENNKLTYKLPESKDLKSRSVIDDWVNDMKERRLNNRIDAILELERLEQKLESVSFDSVTGERYIMENLDYRMELEMAQLPLGRNFLDDTNITPHDRKLMIDSLFFTTNALRTDRYTVHLGMSIADRYVKQKGRKLSVVDYKNTVLACWFLACKFELVYYPDLEDVCEQTQVTNPQILLDIEMDVLLTLNFYVSVPLSIEFLRPLTLIKQREKISHNIAKFFIELSLYVYELAGHPSHIIAAAAYCLSMALSYRMESIADTWTDMLKMFTGLDRLDIAPVICVLGQVLVTTDFDKELPALKETHLPILLVLDRRHTDIMRLSKP